MSSESGRSVNAKIARPMSTGEMIMGHGKIRGFSSLGTRGSGWAVPG